MAVLAKRGVGAGDILARARQRRGLRAALAPTARPTAPTATAAAADGLLSASNDDTDQQQAAVVASRGLGIGEVAGGDGTAARGGASIRTHFEQQAASSGAEEIVGQPKRKRSRKSALDRWLAAPPVRAPLS